jgi:histidyl-tRNA synthetase
LLNNQADISIVHPALLENVRPAEKEIKIKGVGGIQMKVNQVGDLPGFFQVYASEETRAKVLSFADVEDLYEISYVQKEAFLVHMPTGDLVFNRHEKLYVADLTDSDVGVVQATVRENEALYTKEEVRRAKEAYAFLKNSGYPSESEAAHLLTEEHLC